VEKFDATGVTTAQSLNVRNPSNSVTHDSWVTVSPKKRVKSLIHARPKRQSILNPVGESNTEGINPPTHSNFIPGSNAAPLGVDDLILANTVALNFGTNQAKEGDLLDALNVGLEEANMDIYLNLQNLEDVDMSVDSAKRKRIEEEEGTSSQRPT